jgi:hypothetical protein
MVKRLKLATRAFGAAPKKPEVSELAEWIKEHRGRTADIITFQLDRSLAPQLPAGIMNPCAGGKFYADRILSAVIGLEDRKAKGELHVETHTIIEDAAGIVVQKKGAWCAMPAPHALGARDAYYGDIAEWTDALCDSYGTILRTMRDTGVTGNVLICEMMDDAELLALAHPYVLFFDPESDKKSLSVLLERESRIAVRSEQLPVLFDLMNEYTVRKVFLLDPDPGAIALALTHFDPDQIMAGGYCTDDGEDYWKNLAVSAEFEV